MTVHLIAEAERRAFADRSRWLGDPDFVDVPVLRLLDPSYLARRGASIRTDRATPSPSVQPGEPMESGAGNTMHFSVADSGGRAVAFTITLNQWFGTGIVAAGTGKQVFVIRPGRGGGEMAMPVTVSTGLEQGTEIEIQGAGLRAGDRVVCRANERLWGPTPVIATPLPTSQPSD